MTQLPEFTPKSPVVEALMFNVSGRARERGSCTTCGVTELTAESFRDDLSLREYAISGMCQTCQDQVFTEED